tara:strand:- start:261 stop:569 length:309 start_codon:yes stop_codon:yes gene_type:complete
MPQRKVLTQGNDFMGYSMWPIKINYKHMKVSYHISDINFVNDKMILSVDEREIILDIADVSNKLLVASDIERSMYKISPSGYGVHWPLIDEDISVSELMKHA